MKAKVYHRIVDCCLICPAHEQKKNKFGTLLPYCGTADRFLDNSKTDIGTEYPDWCPLEDWDENAQA